MPFNTADRIRIFVMHLAFQNFSAPGTILGGCKGSPVVFNVIGDKKKMVDPQGSIKLIDNKMIKPPAGSALNDPSQNQESQVTVKNCFPDGVDERLLQQMLSQRDSA